MRQNMINDELTMTHEEYLAAIGKLDPTEALKFGYLMSTLMRRAEQEGYDRARAELAEAVVTPGGLKMSHPEDYCHRCFRPNHPWSTPSPLWNEVMRNGDISGTEAFEGIICPMCFMWLAEERGVADTWRLDAQNVLVDLTYTTPSGRQWDSTQWLWVDPVKTRG